ncbi:MAG: serine hydrolase domain-containing protein [Anaerolineae bacterium]
MQWDPRALEKRLAERMEADIASGEIGGAIAVVAQNGSKLCQVVRGASNVTAGTALRYDDIFRLASMTKPLTTAAVMLEVERGRMRIEDKLSRYLPAFRERWVGKLDAAGRAVPDVRAETELTLLHLLTHTNGIISGPVGMAQMAGAPEGTLATTATFIEYMGRKVLLDFEPGSRMAYSGIAAIDILAHLVELTSGLPFPEYLARNLFEPLGMVDTIFVPTAGQRERLVAIHDFVDGKSVALEQGDRLVLGLPNTFHSGSASLLGTAEDYLHFAEMLAAGGEYLGRQVMRPETVAVYRQPRLAPDLPGLAPGTNWGAGVMVRQHTVLPAGSFGWSGAYGTHFWADLANGLAAVYMRNSAKANGAGAATAFRFEEDVMACCLG